MRYLAILLFFWCGAAWGFSSSGSYVLTAQPASAPANPCGSTAPCDGAYLWSTGSGSYSWTKPYNAPGCYWPLDPGETLDWSTFDPVNGKLSLVLSGSNLAGAWMSCSGTVKFVSYPAGPAGVPAGVNLEAVQSQCDAAADCGWAVNTNDATGGTLPNMVGLWDANGYLLKWIVFNADGSVSGGARTLLGSALTAWENCTSSGCAGGSGGWWEVTFGQEMPSEVPASQFQAVTGVASAGSGGVWSVAFSLVGGSGGNGGSTGCAAATTAWNDFCSGGYSALTSGGTATVSNTVSGYSGSETVTCTNGVAAASGGTCVASSCTVSTVANGTVGAPPGCGITCNSGFTLSNGACVSSTGTGGTGGTGTTGTGITSTPLPGFTSMDCNGTNNCDKITSPVGLDPHVAQPTLETTPVASDMVSPLTKLLPSLKAFQVPGHQSTCPTATFTIFGKSVVVDGQCTLFDQLGPQIGILMTVVWAAIAGMIVVRA